MSHLYDNRHYVIFDCTELNVIDFSQVEETSIDTVRKSLDESQTFVKYNFTTYYSGSEEDPVLVETMPSSVEALLNIISISQIPKSNINALYSP